MITRRPGQALLLGSTIEVKLLDVQGRNVRVAIDAPPTVPLLRKELLTNGTTNRGQRIAQIVANAHYAQPSSPR